MADVYVIRASGDLWQTIYGIATTPEKAIDLVHALQENRQPEGGEYRPGYFDPARENIEVLVIPLDTFLAWGA